LVGSYSFHTHWLKDENNTRNGNDRPDHNAGQFRPNGVARHRKQIK